MRACMFIFNAGMALLLYYLVWNTFTFPHHTHGDPPLSDGFLGFLAFYLFLSETNIQSHISALPNTITPYTADALLRMAWATVATASRLSVERAV